MASVLGIMITIWATYFIFGYLDPWGLFQAAKTRVFGLTAFPDAMLPKTDGRNFANKEAVACQVAGLHAWNLSWGHTCRPKHFANNDILGVFQNI